MVKLVLFMLAKVAINMGIVWEYSRRTDAETSGGEIDGVKNLAGDSGSWIGIDFLGDGGYLIGGGMAVEVEGSGGYSLDGGGAVEVKGSEGYSIDGGGAAEVEGSGGYPIDCGGAVEVEGSGGYSINGGGAVEVEGSGVVSSLASEGVVPANDSEGPGALSGANATRARGTIQQNYGIFENGQIIVTLTT
jgi:hypothetical protein